MRPTRVLHIIDGLGGGGSERLLWDIVRLSDPRQVQHRVVTVYPDTDIYDYDSYVYSERLRRAGVYLEQADRHEVAGSQPDLEKGEIDWPTRLKRRLRPLWQAVKATYKLRKSSSSNETESSEIVLPAKGRVDSERLPADSHLALAVALEPEVKQRGLFEIVLPDAVRQITMSYLDFRPDVIHGHTFQGFGLGVYLKLVFRCPFVFTVSALFSQLEDAKADYLPEQFKEFHAGVDRFFTSYPEELLNIGVPVEKIVPSNVVVDLEEIRVVQAERDRHRAEVRKAAGIPESALVALSVGRLHSSKGHQYALETLPFLVTRFPDLHWILIGKASEEERAVVQTRAIELGVDERVHILGFVEKPLPFYAAADIYLRTGILEGDNLSSCQAMAMELPVVGFDTGTASELISTVGHGILVPPKNAEALSAAVQQILSLPDRGRAMGARGTDYCRAHLDIKRLVSMLGSLYTEYRTKG